MAWKFELVVEPLGGTTEGPAWDGKRVLFTHVHTSRIMAYDPRTGECSVYRTDTAGTIGLMVDWRGHLYGCRAGDHCIARYEEDGSVTRLPNVLDGKRHNRPNDLAIDRKGRIWFSDTFGRGSLSDGSTLDHASILRIDPNADEAHAVKRMTFDTTAPNGLLLSRDERTLYVAQSGYKEPVRELRAYPIIEPDSLGEYTVLHSFGRDHRGPHRGIDGMVLDTDGNIIVCAGWREAGPGPMIYVFSPTGQVLETHPFPVDRPTNLTFGGPDLDELYICTSGFPDVSGGKMYKVGNTGRRGFLPYGEVIGLGERRNKPKT